MQIKMNDMFEYTGARSMKSLNLGENFDTSQVTSVRGMFNRLGQTSTTFKKLYLGPKFTKMPTGYFEKVTEQAPGVDGSTSTTVWPAHNAYDNFMKNCGTSALVVYAPESIYRTRNSFK